MKEEIKSKQKENKIKTEDKLEFEELVQFINKNPKYEEIISTDILFEEVEKIITLFYTNIKDNSFVNKLNKDETYIKLFNEFSHIHKSIFLTMLYMTSTKTFDVFNIKCLDYLSKKLNGKEIN